MMSVEDYLQEIIVRILDWSIYYLERVCNAMEDSDWEKYAERIEKIIEELEDIKRKIAEV